MVSFTSNGYAKVGIYFFLYKIEAAFIAPVTILRSYSTTETQRTHSFYLKKKKEDTKEKLRVLLYSL